MNLLSLFIFFILAVFNIKNSFSAKIIITAPCSENILFQSDHRTNNELLGHVMINFLNQNKIPFSGSESGLSSINKTPVGLDAMEVISDSEMMAYGWCYSINGFSPELMPDEVQVKEDDQILWWYGYAHYLDGEWITQCTASHERQNSNFCRKLILEQSH